MSSIWYFGQTQNHNSLHSGNPVSEPLWLPAFSPPRSSTSSWANKSHTIQLRAGLNTITYTLPPNTNTNLELDLFQLYLSKADIDSTPGRDGGYVEYEAEDGSVAICSGGTIVGPSYQTYTAEAHVAAEASGRMGCELVSGKFLYRWMFYVNIVYIVYIMRVCTICVLILNCI